MARALDVAKFIICCANSIEKELSNLKLQKILYFVHRDFYKKFEKKLVDDSCFEAWHYGPVIKQVYREYSIIGSDPIPNPSVEPKLDLSENEKAFIKEQVSKYASEKPWILVQQSHNPNGAWIKVYKKDKIEIIPDELIRQEAQNVEL